MALIAVFCPCPVSSPEPGVTRSIVQCACAICDGLANRIDLDTNFCMSTSNIYLHNIRSLRPARYLYIFISLALLTKNLNIQLPIDMVCSRCPCSTCGPRLVRRCSAPLSRPSDRAACPHCPPCPRPARRGAAAASSAPVVAAAAPPRSAPPPRTCRPASP